MYIFDQIEVTGFTIDTSRGFECFAEKKRKRGAPSDVIYTFTPRRRRAPGDPAWS